MRILPFFLLLACLPTPGRAADRHIGVSGFEKIRVDGPYRVDVTIGVPPSATVSGSPQALDRVSIEVQGHTLVIRPAAVAIDPSGAATGPVTVQVGTHELEMASLNGSGLLSISGATGLRFQLTASGSGSIDWTGAIDQMQVASVGTGNIRLGGTAGKIDYLLKGAGAVDASALAAKDVTLTADGPVTATLNASGTAAINAVGPATITVTGGAACRISGNSTASVSGCR